MRWLLSIVVTVMSAGSAAQVSGIVSLVSDYRFRGVSLSNGQPAAQVDLGFDHETGLYAGLFASNVRLYDESSSQGQAVAYAGYAQRLRNGLDLDFGASYTGFSDDTVYDYSEVYAGFTTASLDGHIHFAPNYFGQSVRTIYAELNGSRRLTDKIRLIGHAGMLKIVSGSLSDTRPNVDERAGFEIAFRAIRLQVSRVASQGSTGVYPVSGRQSNDAWLAMVSYSF